MSLGTRIALGVAVVLTFTLGALGVTMVRATRATLTAEIDNQLLASVQRARDLPGPRAGMVTEARREHDAEPAGDRSSGDSRDTDAGAIARPVDDRDQDKEQDEAFVLDQVLERHKRDHFDLLLPGISSRNQALIIFGPAGGKKLEEPSGYADAPDSPPALPPIPSPMADRLMGKIVTLPSVDGALRYRVLMLPWLGGATLITAAPLRSVDEAVNALVRTLIMAGLLGLAAASLVSWWVIRHGLRPVDRMVETAAAIADGDLSRRVPDADPETELGRLGTALNEMLGQIEAGIREREATEAKLRRFVADAAHELRTPLTSLRGYAELYRQGALPTGEAVGNAMGRIESEGARMARLVDDLLLLARTDQGRALEKEPVDLVRLAREAAGDFSAADPRRPVERDLDGSAVVVGDPIRLRQAIDNLLANVRAHTPENTPARVSVQRNGAWAEVTVADDGPGIAADDQRRVFERFWRGDPSRGRTAAGGAGLGLSIVDALVRAHGGTVAVSSTPGRGSAFTLRLPLMGDG